MIIGKIPISLTELSIDTVLRCGQSFRWKKSGDGSYSCALHGRLLTLRQDATHLHFNARYPAPVGHSTTPSPLDGPLTPRTDEYVKEEPAINPSEDDTEAFVKHYLNLDLNLEKLYEAWAGKDGNFRKKAPRFTGIRILRQDAWEALVGFICSSNNNIARISQMMDKLCANYGPLIGHIEEQPFYDMPSPTALTNPRVELHLRELGFGYRAKYLHQTAIMITREKEGWLDDLRNPENPILGRVSASAGDMQSGGREGYRKAHELLLGLQGVGPKVADCVCLMGLGWGEAVPVDTHVWQIAQRDYKFGKGKHRSLTKATYDEVGDLFRKLWGKEAGWAHSVLFTADLRAFAERLAPSSAVQVGNEVVKAEDAVAQAFVSGAGGAGDNIKLEQTVDDTDVRNGRNGIKQEGSEAKSATSELDTLSTSGQQLQVPVQSSWVKEEQNPHLPSNGLSEINAVIGERYGLNEEYKDNDDKSAEGFRVKRESADVKDESQKGLADGLGSTPRRATAIKAESLKAAKEELSPTVFRNQTSVKHEVGDFQGQTLASEQGLSSRRRTKRELSEVERADSPSKTSKMTTVQSRIKALVVKAEDSPEKSILRRSSRSKRR